MEINRHAALHIGGKRLSERLFYFLLAMGFEDSDASINRKTGVLSVNSLWICSQEVIECCSFDVWHRIHYWKWRTGLLLLYSLV